MLSGHAHGLELAIEWLGTAVVIGWIVWLLITGRDKRAQMEAEAEWHQVHAMVLADDWADTRYGIPSYLDSPELRAKVMMRRTQEAARVADRERRPVVHHAQCQHAAAHQGQGQAS
jgi:hypothetical protein